MLSGTPAKALKRHLPKHFFRPNIGTYAILSPSSTKAKRKFLQVKATNLRKQVRFTKHASTIYRKKLPHSKKRCSKKILQNLGKLSKPKRSNFTQFYLPASHRSSCGILGRLM